MQKIFLASIVFVIALLPRVINLHGHCLTADELTWMSQADEFTKRISAGDIVHSLDAGHLLHRSPVVVPVVGFFRKLFGRGISGGLLNFADLVVASRLPIAFLGALGCAVFFLLARNIWSNEISFCGALFLALSPFHIALSRIVGDEVVLNLFVIISILLYAVAERKGKSRLKVVSGIFFGLAFLTKFQALFVIAIIFFWKVLLRVEDKQRRAGSLFNAADIYFLVAGLATFICLNPSVWSNPFKGFGDITSTAWNFSQARHPVFFLGKYLSASPWFYYPVLLFMRMPELLAVCFLLGIPLLVIYHVRRKKLFEDMLLLLLWILVPLITLSLQGYKNYNFLLLIWPAVCMIGSACLFALPGLGSVNYTAIKILPAIIILVFSLPALIRFSPNYYLYFNSFVGGPKKAQELVMIGWGEGHSGAAEYIKRRAGEGRRVAVFGYDSIISYYYKGEVIDIPANKPPHFAAGDEPRQSIDAEKWEDCDYLVTYINKIQRFPDHPVVLYGKTHKPAYTVVLNGVAVAWVYKLSEQH